MSTASRRGPPTVATGDLSWLNLSHARPGMHCGGQGRVVGLRGGKDGAPWLLSSGPDLGGVAGREPSPGRPQPSQPAPGDPRGQRVPSAGSAGRVTALTDSLDGIPENPTIRGSPHRQGAGGNPAIWVTRPTKPRDPVPISGSLAP